MMSSLMAISPFEGAYSNDTYEKESAASGFKHYGYTPEEYYQNKTNAFPSIVNGETGWTFWVEVLGQVTCSIKKRAQEAKRLL